MSLGNERVPVILACYASIINRFFLSLDLFTIEMDSFQHKPWLIITSFTYHLALDSASGLESFTLESTQGITKKQKNKDHLFDSGCHQDVSVTSTHTQRDTCDTAIQDRSWIMWASEKPFLLSLLDDEQSIFHTCMNGPRALLTFVP